MMLKHKESLNLNRKATFVAKNAVEERLHCLEYGAYTNILEGIVRISFIVRIMKEYGNGNPFLNVGTYF
jgi:hypothetical protein